MAKNIRIIIIACLAIIIIGVFIYVKIKDNDSIDNLNTLTEHYRTGNKKLRAINRSIKKQLVIYARTIEQLEQRNNQLETALKKSQELQYGIDAELTDSLTGTEKLENINRTIQERITDSLRIVGELKQYNRTE